MLPEAGAETAHNCLLLGVCCREGAWVLIHRHTSGAAVRAGMRAVRTEHGQSLLLVTQPACQWS